MRKNKLCIVFVILFGWFSLFPLKELYSENFNFSNSVISLVMWGINSFIFWKALHVKCKKYFGSFILALIYSLCLYFGKYIELEYSIPDLSIFNIFCYLSLFLFLWAMVLLLFDFIPVIYKKISKYENKFSFLYKRNKRKYIIIFIIIFICWIPAFLCSAPGVFGYDAPHQYWQIDTGNIKNSQPIFSSFIMYIIMNFGEKIFGNYNAGLACFIILQMIFAAFANTLVCYYMEKYNVPVIFIIFTIIYYALHPMHHLFIVNATKDVLFSYLFLFLIMILIDMIYDKKIFLTKKYKLCIYFLCVLICMLYRNNGVYVILLLIPFIIFLIRQKKIIFITVCAIVCYFAITNGLYPYMNYGSSSFVEMLAIPTQQMANAYVNEYDKLTNQQIKDMFEYLPDGTVEEYQTRYHPRNSDYIRPNLKKENISANWIKFLKTYINIGKTCPKAYINGFLNNTLAYWYPDADMPDSNAEPQKYIEYENSTYETISVMTDRFNWLPKLQKFYGNIGQEGSFKSVPVISMLFSIGLVFWLYLFMFIYAIEKKEYKILIPILALLFLWLTSVAGPVALVRYVYAMFLCLPLLNGILLEKIHGKYNSNINLYAQR